jgi:hypothetical protein
MDEPPVICKIMPKDGKALEVLWELFCSVFAVWVGGGGGASFAWSG